MKLNIPDLAHRFICYSTSYSFANWWRKGRNHSHCWSNYNYDLADGVAFIRAHNPNDKYLKSIK